MYSRILVPACMLFSSDTTGSDIAKVGLADDIPYEEEKKWQFQLERALHTTFSASRLLYGNEV